MDIYFTVRLLVRQTLIRHFYIRTCAYGDLVLYAQMDLLDSARARRCLSGTYMVMLGDSTMSETMHDLVMLLGGLATAPDAMKAYMENATRCACFPCQNV